MAACSFARFVIHYRNGNTLIEDRKDNSCWDNAPKENIAALGILFDPGIIHVDNKVLKANGNILRFPFNENTLKGSKKYNYQFFQYKDTLLSSGNVGNFTAGKNELGLVIGMVLNSDGHCMVMRGKPSCNVSVFYTTVHSLGLNLELFEIDLERCGTGWL